MKNKAVIILLFIVAGLFAALYMMGYFPFGNEPEELNIDDFSIKSNDESAVLIIPVDALPDNVDIDDVSVTKAPNIVTENGTWIVYNLEPDGLVFKEEVLFNVTLESVNNTVPIVFISSSNGVDLVNNTFSEFDLENGTQIVSIPLSHFSVINIGKTTTFSLKLSAPDVLVGERVNTIASFTFVHSKLLLDRTGTGEGISVCDFLDPRVRYKGEWTNFGNSFTPVGIFGDIPSSINVNLGQTNTVKDDTFKGNADGATSLFYTVYVTANVKLTHYDSESDYLDGKVKYSANYRNFEMFFYSDVYVKCTTPKLIIQTTNSISFENKPGRYLIVDIKGPPNKAGFATLTGSGMDPMIQPVLLGPNGFTQITFIHTFLGEVTISVKVGAGERDELNAERKIIIH